MSGHRLDSGSLATVQLEGLVRMSEVPDPAQIDSPDDLASALGALLKSKELSLRLLEAKAKQLPRTANRARSLPRSTISDLLRSGQPSKETLITFLLACDLPPAAHASWISAWERARTSAVKRPRSALRVRQADARLLGVHAAIPAAGEVGLPLYIDRDIERGPEGILKWLKEARYSGGFLLLVGGSCVGKTRSAYESVLKQLPDWWLFHPKDASEIKTLAESPSGPMVLWLDELHNYLGDGGLDAGTVRALLADRRPKVIIGTLWPNRFNGYMSEAASDQPSRSREVISLAHTIRVRPDFSPSERHRATAAGYQDRRIWSALHSEFGVTQTLAAGPLLFARWQDSATENPYAWAIVTAALDATRIGVSPPMSSDFLRKAAVGYCNRRQRAAADKGWFEKAIAYATREQDGAASLLTASAAEMEGSPEYTPADFLVDRATRIRRAALIPGSVWEAVLDIDDGYVCSLAGDSAFARLFYTHAERLYRRAIGMGYFGGVTHSCVTGLVEILRRQGRVEDLEDLARQGHTAAFKTLQNLYLSAGDFNKAFELVEWWDAHDATGLGVNLAFDAIFATLRDHNRASELRAWADRDLDEHYTKMGVIRTARKVLAELLARRAAVDELIDRANEGDIYATRHLADFGYEDEVVALLNARLRACAPHVYDYERTTLEKCLNELLRRRGQLELSIWDVTLETPQSAIARFDEAGLLKELGARAAQGEIYIGRMIARYLKEQGRLDELRELANGQSGYLYATPSLADALVERGLHAELRQRAEARDRDAADRLMDLYADQRQTLDLKRWAKQGNAKAARKLAGLGLTEEALNILRSLPNRDWECTDIFADLLARVEKLDELEALAKQGNQRAKDYIADLLKSHGEAERLMERALSGETPSRDRLVELFVERGEPDEAVECLQVTLGEWDGATSRYLELLVARRRVTDLRAEVLSGTAGAADAYLQYLKDQQQIQKAHAIEVNGLDPDDYLDL